MWVFLRSNIKKLFPTNQYPGFFQNAKICAEQKRSKSVTKTNLLKYFWAAILKAIVIFGISTLKFVKNKFLVNTANFGIGSTFSKGPGSTFS